MTARSYGAAALLALVVASLAFVSHRNRTYAARELGRAGAVAAALAAGEPAPDYLVAGGRVDPPRRSPRYPFLHERRLDGGRRLGGPAAAPDDKLVYDAAGRAERTGAFARLLEDGRVLAALPAPGGGAAVALLEPPTRPEAYPWLVVLGLLAIGGLVAAAGALAGGAARAVGLVLGASGLAVPCWLWAGPGPAIAVIAIALGAAWADRRGALDHAWRALREQRVAYLFLAPTALAMLVLVAVPFAVGLVLGFHDHSRGQWQFVGLDNFAHILSGGGRALSDPLNFWFTLGVTVAWTAVNVALHVALGVALALLLRQRWLHGRGAYRVLFILPWAIPNYITAIIWRGMFQSEYGAINALLGALGLDQVAWFSSWATAFAANVATNTWLGFPFMMVVALGALEAIPRELGEAAAVDGASAWQRFRHITLPHLRPALAPAVVLGSIWTFNMFNVIYLVSDGRPHGSTNILVTEAYNWAFERGERYGMAAAYAVLIFLILLAWTLVGTRAGRKEAGP